MDEVIEAVERPTTTATLGDNGRKQSRRCGMESKERRLDKDGIDRYLTRNQFLCKRAFITCIVLYLTLS